MPITDDLARFRALAGLTRHQLDQIASLSTRVSLEAGQRMFVEGQPADRCWLILSGQVEVDTAAPGGPLPIQTLGPGDLLGWSWLVPPYRWDFGARVAAGTEAIVVDAARLRVLADGDPGLGYPLAKDLLAVLLDRLQHTRARLLDLYGSPHVR